MTIEGNKEFVKRTWETLLGGDVEAALANFSDDVTWFITGKLEGVSGLKKGKEAVRAFLGGVTQAFPGGLKTEFKKSYGEGDTVIVQRAGDVIPQVVGPVVSKRTGKERKYKLPKRCPACGTEVERPEGEAMAYCPNGQSKIRAVHSSA